jgi:Protein kinase domain
MFSPTPGALVANRFRLRHAIGKGGMGQVWEAHDGELDSPCAVKFILDHMAQDPEARLRIVREARAVARLRSPHVVTILGVGEHADAMYLAMELLEGETLARRLERTGKLDATSTVTLMEQVVHVLDKAHANGIVHRDLKPDNLWLSADPKPFIKVLDFGVAKSTLAVGTSQTASGALMGTPQYMSPEQANGDREVDHRSDLWALAIIVMECLSGRRPFESSGLGDLLMKIMSAAPPAVQALDPALPASLGAWWQRALARDPNQRFQTGADLLDALRSGLTLSAGAAGAPILADTDRGTWTAAPLPPRTPTLVTSIAPTPVSVPALTAAPLPLGSARVAAPPEAGPSVGPLTHTAQLAQPVRVGSRRLRWLGAGAVAVALALIASWVALRSPLGTPPSPATSAAGPQGGATHLAELPTTPAATPPAATAAPAAPAVRAAPAAPAAPAVRAAPAVPVPALKASPSAIGPSAPRIERAPAPEAASKGSARARRKASPRPAAQAPGQRSSEQSAPARNAKLKARLGF